MKKSDLRLVVKGIVRSILKENAGGPTLSGMKKTKGETVYPPDFRNSLNYIRLVKKPSTGEFVVVWMTSGKRNEGRTYYTNDLRDAIDTFNDMKTGVDIANNVNLSEDSVTGAVAPVSTPKAFVKKTVTETTTGDVSGYNIPAAFSTKGGSQRGVAGSAKLGYELTPIGKKEMDKRGDRL